MSGDDAQGRKQIMIDGEFDWWQAYASASVADQRRAVYGRCCRELVAFIKDHAGEYGEVVALRDAAADYFRSLLEATIALGFNISPGLRQDVGLEE